MAKRKPDRKKDSPRRPPKTAGGSSDLPDRRAMEALLRDVMEGMGDGGDPNSPLGRAQQVLEQAYDEPSPVKRVELARQALAVCPDCADAYVLLGEQAASRTESLEMYEKAVAAAERALGPETFREAEGDFWGILETRPYMRARQALAHTLWTVGRQEEAVAHARDLLRLNPNDNQGLRYTLAGWLLNLDRDDELARLLEQYPEEESAVWAYTRALLAFRRHGDTPESRKLLQQAKKVNKHVPDYVLGKKRMPDEQPPYYRPGDSSEAVEYLAGSLAAWKNTAGAVDWLREATASKRKTRGAAAAQGPLPLVVERLKRLPQKGDIWQADCRELPMLVEGRGGQPRRPWLFLAISLRNGNILAQEVGEEKPSTDRMWEKLAQAMQKPFMGDPQRPAELQVRPGLGWDELRPSLEDLGIRCAEQEELQPMANVVAHLAESLGGQQETSLLDIRGVTPEQVGRFYEAAADFYRQAPWRRLGYENAVRVECEQMAGGPWYAVLMGQSGLTMGVALYDDLDLLKRLWAGDLSDEENAQLTVATSLTFGDSSEVALADVEAARRYGWKVARPDAYPSIFRKERGLSMRAPDAAELELMEACLRVLPDFVKRRRQDDDTPETIATTVAAGGRTMKLAWVRP